MVREITVLGARATSAERKTREPMSMTASRQKSRADSEDSRFNLRGLRGNSPATSQNSAVITGKPPKPKIFGKSSSENKLKLIGIKKREFDTESVATTTAAKRYLDDSDSDE